MKRRNALKFISLVLSILMVLAVFASCSNNEENGENETSTDNGNNGAADNNDNVIDLDKLGDPGYRRPEYSDFIPLSRAAAAEGMVLLKNEDNLLPLDKNDTVTLVGSGSVNTVKGPSGTGSVKSANSYSLLAGMQIKEEEGKVAVNAEIAEAYAKDKRYKPELEDMQKAKEKSDVALFIITRSSKSGSDKNDQMGGYYLSSDEVSTLGKLVKAGFEDIVVVLNVGTVIDTTRLLEFPQVKSILLAWQPGEYNGLAMADVLVGDINPSGKLTDTMAKSYRDYPSADNFEKSADYVDYKEDIFVGYRYFETFDGNYDKVNFEFGYGLSYTTFEYSDASFDFGEDSITVRVKVTNTGNYHGKETAQVYFTAPAGELGKPGKELCAFAKTVTLYPGEAQILTMTIDMAMLASYDDTGKVQKSAYVIEEGDYDFYVGGSIKHAVETGLGFTYTVNETKVVKQLTEQLTARNLKERLLADGSYEDVFNDSEITVKTATSDKAIIDPPSRLILFGELYEHPELFDSFLAQMSDESLLYLLYGHVVGEGKNPPAHIASFDTYAIPGLVNVEGTSGLSGVSGTATAWPIPTALACTWNPELLERVGKEIALEAKEKGVSIWLAPSVNIHRNPLSGANFESFSEDPYLTGVMATSLINGVQENGIGVCMGNLVCAEKEYNRNNYDVRVSERALREIYLLPFEMAIKNADPWMLMTSYNRVNGMETATNYELLTEIVRKEWGYDGVITTESRNNTDILNEILAGHDLKMPNGSLEAIKAAMAEGKVTRAMLLEHAERIIKLVLKTGEGKIAENAIRFDPNSTTTIHSVDFSSKSNGIGEENCADEGVEKNTTGNEEGRYLAYNIVSWGARDFEVTVRVASPDGTGAFNISLDGNQVASFQNTLNTGDWQVWGDAEQTFVITIPAGSHELRIDFTQTGLNFSKLTFNPVAPPAPAAE